MRRARSLTAGHRATVPADLLNAVRVVAAGEALLAPTVTRDRAQLVIIA